jgi:DNA ligase-1
VDKLYLDTTYAHPRHCFQSQDDSIVQIVQQTREFFASHGVERSIVYLSAYTIGKEKVIFAVCDELLLPIYMDDDKLLIMRQIEGGIERIEQGLFVSDPTLAHIHICKMGFAGSLHPFFKPHFENIAANIEHLNSLLQATTTSRNASADLVTIEHSLAFIPSGWADSGSFNRRNSSAFRDSSTVQLIAYSEHSQCNELMEFVRFLRPKQVVPTVFSDDKQRVAMLDMFAPLLDRKDCVRRFFVRFPHYSSLKNDEVDWRDKSFLVESEAKDQSVTQVVVDDATGLSSCNHHCSILPFDASSSFDRRPSMPMPKQKLTSTRANKKSKMTHDFTKAVTADQTASVTTSKPYGPLPFSPTPWQCVACTFKHSSPATIDYLQCSICLTPKTSGVQSPRIILQENELVQK